jgi:hypothetical protein
MPSERQAEAAGRTEAQINRAQRKDEVLDKMVEKYLLENSDNPEFLDGLPPSQRAQIILSRLPKPVQMDAGLERAALSLTSSLEDLPNVPDLTEALLVAKTEAKRWRSEAEVAKKTLIEYRNSLADPTIFNSLLSVMRDLLQGERDYWEHRRSSPLSDEEWESALREVMGVYEEDDES